MPQVKRNETISLTVDSRLEHHLIGWILQSRSPEKLQPHWLDDRCQRVKDRINFIRGYADDIQVLWPLQHRLVLDH